MTDAALPHRKIELTRYPKIAGRHDAQDGNYWKKLQSPALVHEYGTVNAIAFSPVSPHDFAVAALARVQLYGGRTRAVQRTISRFKETVYSVDFRRDGRMMAAGDGEGHVQLFNAQSRAILRTMRGHTRPVHVTRFSSDNTQIMTCSDDRSVRLWDIPSEKVVVQFDEHQDYVRAGRFAADNPSLLVSASYDHTIRLWDARSNSCVMTMQHGQPVEDVIAFPGGSLVVSAGGPTLKVWDLLVGGRLVQAIGNHQKTVTCMAMAKSASRLITGSLDQHVKIYDPSNWKVVHTFQQTSPVLSIGISPDDSVLAVGMASGMLSVRHREHSAEDAVARMEKEEAAQQQTIYRFRPHGADTEAIHQKEFVVRVQRAKRLPIYEKHLRQFKYGNALDAVLTGRHPSVVVVSLLQELVHRGQLRAALIRRDDVALEPLLTFLYKHIPRPNYTSILTDITAEVLDIYEPVLVESTRTATLLAKLKTAVHEEVRRQHKLINLMGAVDMVLSVASINMASATAPDEGVLENAASVATSL